MPQSLPPASALHQSGNPDITRPRMAKANVGNPDIIVQPWRQRVGGAFGRAVQARGWTLDRAARELGKDPREVGKWATGDRCVQVDRVMAVAELAEPFALELASLVVDVVIETTVKFRRRA